MRSFRGDLDEVRISAAVRSADWIATEYANQNSPGTFYSTGSQEAARIVVAPRSGLSTTEAGGTAQFDVVLETQPTDDVTIGISSSDTSEGTVSTSSLTFTTGNWDTPQTVTVTGQDDALFDGDQAYTILTAAATSSDPNYNGLDPSDVAVTNVDDDTATVSGIVYIDEGTTNIGANKTVRLAINGTDFGTTAETDSGGAYTLSTVPMSAGDVWTVYLEDETENAVSVTVSNGLTLAGLDLYQDQLIARHDNGGSLTNADLATAAVAGEDDISGIYTLSGADLTVANSKELLVWTGDTFAPGGNITVDDIDIDGTLTMAANDAEVHGSWDAAGGSFTTSGRVTLLADTTPYSAIIDDGDAGYASGGAWSHFLVGYNGDEDYDNNTANGANWATWTFSVTPGTYKVAATWDPHFNRSNQVPYTIYDNATPLASVPINQEVAPDGDLTLGGRLFQYVGGNDATYTITSGTLAVRIVNSVPAEGNGSYLIADAIYIDKQFDPPQTVTSGGSAFYDLELAGGTYILQDNLDVDNDLVISAGVLDVNNAAPKSITVGHDWNNAAGTSGFLARTGAVDLDGDPAGRTVSGSTDFYNLAISTATAQTVSFQSGQTQSVTAGGSLTFSGADGQLLTLAPVTPASDWLLDVDAAATQSVSYVSAELLGRVGRRRRRRGERK